MFKLQRVKLLYVEPKVKEPDVVFCSWRPF